MSLGKIEKKIRSIIYAIKFDLLNGILVIWDLLSAFIKKVSLICIFVKIIQCVRKILTHFLSSRRQLSHDFHIGPCEFPNAESYVIYKNGNSLFFSFFFMLLITFIIPFTTDYSISLSCKMSFSWMMYMGWRETHSLNELYSYISVTALDLVKILFPFIKCILRNIK